MGRKFVLVCAITSTGDNKKSENLTGQTSVMLC